MGGDDVGGFHRGDIHITYYIPPELWGIVRWTESNGAKYIHFIYQERLDATTTEYDAGHSITSPMCVLH